jgi:hypothetical protein
LNLLWGVRAFFYDKLVSTDDTIDDINKICVDRAYVNKGDMYNNNLRYGTAWIGEKKSLIGGSTFFTNQSEKLNY